LWHRLDLDFMSNESNIGRLSAYIGDPTCWLTDHTSQLRGAWDEPDRNCRDVGMTEIDKQTDQRGEQQTAEVEVSADSEPAAPEMLVWRRDDVFSPETDGNTEQFPSLRTSRPIIFSGVVRPLESAPPEYMTLSMRPARTDSLSRLCSGTCCGKRPSSGGASSTWTTRRSR
jgi:hypothetical protein